MKIAYFIDHLRPDGTQFVLKQLVRGMAPRGHEQMIFCLNDSWDKNIVRQLQELGPEVAIIGKPALFSGLGIYSILKKLLQGKYDVVVTLLFASDVIGRPLARLARVPRIITSIQTHDEFYKPWQRWLERQTMRFSDVVLLNSHHVREFAISQEGADPEQIQVIYNSIQAKDYGGTNTRDYLNQEFNIPENAILLGSVGRLYHQKGFDILLLAIAKLSSPEIHLLIAGMGEEMENLEAQTIALGIADQVTFAGHRWDVPVILRGIDYYVHPSRFEGMPIAILEAMATGCTIIATRVDGTRELIEDGVHGWLVPPEDPVALANSIRTAIADKGEAKRRGLAARNRVITQFSEDAMMDAWEAVFMNRPQEDN